MRGDLRIFSRFAPFRRAGLAWGDVDVAVEISIADLDGERLLALVNDPAIRIEAQTDDSEEWQPLPKISSDVTAEQAQMMIDAIASELPPRAAAEKVFTVAEALAERDEVQAELGDAQARLLSAEQKIGELEKTISARDASIIEKDAEIGKLRARVVGLEVAAVQPPKPKTKATEKASAEKPTAQA